MSAEECPDCGGKGVDDDYVRALDTKTRRDPETGETIPSAYLREHTCELCNGEGRVEFNECAICEESVPVPDLDDSRICPDCRARIPSFSFTH